MCAGDEDPYEAFLSPFGFAVFGFFGVFAFLSMRWSSSSSLCGPIPQMMRLIAPIREGFANALGDEGSVPGSTRILQA